MSKSVKQVITSFKPTTERAKVIIATVIDTRTAITQVGVLCEELDKVCTTVRDNNIHIIKINKLNDTLIDRLKVVEKDNLKFVEVNTQLTTTTEVLTESVKKHKAVKVEYKQDIVRLKEELRDRQSDIANLKANSIVQQDHLNLLKTELGIANKETYESDIVNLKANIIAQRDSLNLLKTELSIANKESYKADSKCCTYEKNWFVSLFLKKD